MAVEKEEKIDDLAIQATTAMTLSNNANDVTVGKKLTNLTSSANHSSILFATDEWFATAENLLNPAPPIFVPDLFCDQGKVMDGWETRRRRTAGHDWCVVKLGGGDYKDFSGRFIDRSYMISMIELDTGYFTGNQTPRVSIEAMKVTRPSISNNEIGDNNNNDQENEDYLYNWMPGASTRLARGNGGKGIRGTGQSPAVVKNALEACKSVAQNSGISNNNNPNGEWITILPMTALQPGYEESRYHTFEVSEKVKRQIEGLGGVTHLKLNYYPDGGVARMKVHGYPSCHPSEKLSNAISDTATSTHNHTPRIHPHSSPNPPPSSQPYHHPELSSNTNGGIGLACSNKHYGVPSNLLRPHLGIDMGDGWETARHPNRPPVITKDPTTGLQDTELMDWSVVKLGSGGAKVDEGISRIIVDTRHFKGNFPESVTIDACYADPDEKNVVSDEDVCKSAGKEVKSQNGSIEWFPLLKRTLLTADAEHEFLREHGHNYIVNGRRGATHLRISITPDGGLSRVRIYGSPANVNKYVEKYVPPRSHL